MTLKKIASVFILASATASGQGPQTFMAVHCEPDNTQFYPSPAGRWWLWRIRSMRR